MKKFLPLLLSLLLVLSGCAAEPAPVPTTFPIQTNSTEAPPPQPIPTEPAPAPIIPLPPPEPTLRLSPEEKEMLLKIGMAERGSCGCPECIALVMRTLLNRVESPRFGNSIQSVLFAPEQFTPVMDGSYDKAKPNENCYDALDMVLHGWDESQGALYYEWCEGESWHSQNLQQLFQHCNIRFYIPY